MPVYANATIVISYAREDEQWRALIRKHLEVVAPRAVWDDRELLPGDKWDGEIRSAIQGCSLAVFLVSVDSLTSRYVIEVEIPLLLAKDARPILPVLVRPVPASAAEWLTARQYAPPDGVPLSERDDSETQIKAFAEKVGSVLVKSARGERARQGGTEPGMATLGLASDLYPDLVRFCLAAWCLSFALVVGTAVRALLGPPLQQPAVALILVLVPFLTTSVAVVGCLALAWRSQPIGALRST